VLGVEQEQACMQLCAGNHSCSLYTWYNASETLANTCFLMRNCSGISTACRGCFTGPPSCQAGVGTTTQQPEAELGILVTGGFIRSGVDTSSVELLHGDGTPWCRLPELPQDRYYHTQSGLGACGGSPKSATTTTCVRFSGGSWSPSHNLQQARWHHSSWASPAGTVLMGGDYSGSRQTTELLDEATVDSVMHFSLRYDTRFACSIEMAEVVILTGGADTRSLVTVYNNAGFVGDLPSLNTGRYSHGCGHFVNTDNQVVYLVAGGYTGSSYLTSTELLVDGDSSWVEAAPLPLAMSGLGTVSLDNTIISTGGMDSNNAYATILKFDPRTFSWSQVGEMDQTRNYHGASVVRAEDVEQFCV